MSSNSRNTVISASVSPDTFIKLKGLLAASGNVKSVSGLINHLVMAVARLPEHDFNTLLKADPDKIAELFTTHHAINWGDESAQLPCEK